VPDVSLFLSSFPGSLRAPLARSDRMELMDAPVDDPAELAENFRDIERVNRLLGGTSIILRHLPALIPPAPAGPITILDLATGSADIPLAVVRWAKRRHLDVQVIASDYAPDILDVARARCAGESGIALTEYDARALPLPNQSVDIVLCSLALHHFDPADAVRVLREMHRLGRRGFIVNDLRRERLAFAAAWVAAHLTTRNRLTRHDAPLSVRRAYTPAELAGLLDQAGVDGASITTHPWFRMAAVARGERP
jgi:ubiquinone/menaquinone biosynthesis C-methylase UbiE